MPPFPPSPPPEAILAHRSFLRAIARSLLRGDDGDEDVVQEALVRAWQAEPQPPAQMRAWLARVARNLTLDHLRARRRAQNLERQAPRSDAMPSPADVLQHEEQRHRVVRAVLTLPQPYQATVLLRYWEDLTPTQIAARLGLPGATVRSQLKRGLALLRERLDADYGDRRAWMAVLLPFARPAGAATTATISLGTLLMTKSKLVLAGAAVLLVSLLGALAWQSQPTPPDAPPTGSTTVAQASPAANAAAPSVTPTPTAAATPSEVQRAPAATAMLTVRGQVQQRGVPFPGLRLTLQWYPGAPPNGPIEGTHEVDCDGNGRFEWIGEQRRTPGTLRCVAKGPVKLWADDLAVAAGQAEAELRCSVIPFDRVLTGRVHDAAGRPIANADLTINEWPESRARSDAAGLFEMRVPAPGYPLVVTAEGYQQRLLDDYLPADAMRHAIDIELTAGVLLRGRVVDALGQPVAGASVSPRSNSPEHTDADGRFTIDGQTPGASILVAIAKPGYRPAMTLAVPGGKDLELVLLVGAQAELLVLDQEAHPVAEAIVSKVEEHVSRWDRCGLTAADGRFTIEDLAPGPVEVVVQKPGFALERCKVEAGSGTKPTTIVLRSGHPLHAAVVDAAGQPVAGAWVSCELRDAASGSRALNVYGESDAEGRVALRGLPPEPITVVAVHDRYQRASFDLVGGATTEVTLRLQDAPTVTGRVLDAVAGTPVADFTLEFRATSRRHKVHIDPMLFHTADGAFAVRHGQLPIDGEVEVEVRASGYAAQRLRCTPTLTPSPDQLVFRLAVGAHVVGIVRDAATGEPLAGATVELQRDDPNPQPNVGPATDATGAFALDAVPPGTHRLCLSHPDRPDAVSPPFDVLPGQRSLELQVTMARGATLRGRITGTQAPAELQVRAYRASGPAREATVLADGTFTLTGLGEGRTTLSVTDQDVTRRIRIDVGARDLDGVELPLRSGAGSIRVEVVGADRGRADVRRLDATAGEPPLDLSMPFAGTSFAVDGLAPGRYELRVMPEGPAKAGRAEVLVGNGATAITISCDAR